MSVLKYDGHAFDTDVEVLIIGSGACGTIAALAANEQGAEVLVLERDAKPSGNTALSGGQIPAAGTKFQKAAGLLDDTPELLYQDIIAKAHGECDHDIARVVAYEAAKTVEWLVDRYALPLSCVLDFQYPGHSRPHMHASPSRFGAELLAVLLTAVEGEGIPIATSALATDLYADDSGRIHGVRVRRPDGASEEIGCQTLILACNGFGGNRDMLSKYMPEAAGMFYEGHVGNQGDAIRWGEALGASVRDMGSFQGFGAVCDPHGMHLSYPHITEGGFHVNRDGLRFSNENAGYSEQALCVYRQPGHVAWAIWDDRCEQVANKQHSHVLANEAGAIKRYDSVDAMAAAIGCPAGALAQTLAEVEACTRGERTDAFGRNFRGKPVLRAPYYFARIMGALTHTQGGLEIDTQGRVLRPDRSAFPNLFAGGGAARGLSGPADWGYLSGSGLLMATNMGRIAGEVAAAQALAARASSAGQR